MIAETPTTDCGQPTRSTVGRLVNAKQVRFLLVYSVSCFLFHGVNMNWYSIGSEVVMQTAWMLNGMALYWLFIDKPNRMSRKSVSPIRESIQRMDELSQLCDEINDRWSKRD